MEDLILEDSLNDLKRARLLEYSAARRDLGLYIQAAWHVLEPTSELKWNWHHDLICEHLEACALGQINRLVINIAPRSTKSILATIGFPTWVWTNKPHERFLFGSYADTLAAKHSVFRRNLIESPWYQRGYGDTYRMASDVNTKTEFANDKTGLMRSSGIRAVPMGEGGDYIIIDDPHNPKGAESEPDREAAVMNFDLGWSTRLNDKKTGRIIVIMQRLHEKDLTGHILEQGGYTHLCIPTIAEERTTLHFPLSGKTIQREVGDLMHPARDGPEEIAQAKVDLGPYGFSGQHQQTPTPKSGGLFTAAMFDYVAPPMDHDYRFITADTAYKDKQENDFTVFSAWAVKGGELYLLDCLRQQVKAVEVEALSEAFILRFSQYGFRAALIEPKGHGIYLNQAFQKKGILVPSEDDLDAFFSDRHIDKVTRANNAVPHLANRRVHINPLIDQKELLVSEALRFPKAAHDDFVDTLVDAIKYFHNRTASILDVL